MQIILPQNPAFQETLDNIPFFWGSMQREKSDHLHLVADSQSGLLRPCSDKEFEEYVFGGELDERLDILEDQEIIDQCLGYPLGFSPHILING